MDRALALRIAEACAHAAATAAAWACARPTLPRIYLRSAAPLAAFLGASLAADGVRAAVQALVLASSSRPFTDGARAAFHVEQALFVAWPCGLATLCAWLFLAVPARRLFASAHAILWVSACAGLALSYPEVRGAVLGRSYALIHLGALAASSAHVIVGAVDGPRFDRSQRAALWLLAADAGALAGPYAGTPFDSWWLAQACSVAAYLLVAVDLLGRRP